MPDANHISVHDASSATRRFSYRRPVIHALFALIVIALGVALVLLPLYPKPGWKAGEAFIGVAFLYFLMTLINLMLVDSDIEVNSIGISVSVLGWRWRAVNWSDVRHARILFPSFVAGPGKGQTIKLYRLYETDGSPFYFTRRGGIGFNSTIAEFAALEDIAKSQIKKWNIPLAIDEKRASRYKG